MCTKYYAYLLRNSCGCPWEQYNPKKEEWPQYMERLEQFFEANDLMGDDKADKRWAIFLSRLSDWHPTNCWEASLLLPKEKKYGELVAKLTDHYSPTPSEVMKCFRFNSRSRKAGETESAYVVGLRLLAQHCNYNNTLDKMLRDQIIWGRNDDATQGKLLQVKELMYKKVVCKVLKQLTRT